jgi:PAS domain S-box-containing protein
MAADRAKLRRLDRLIYFPALATIVVIWSVVAAFTYKERNDALDKAQVQLGFAVAALADASPTPTEALSPNQVSSARTSAILRMLVLYPTAQIWLTDEAGAVIAGEMPKEDFAGFIVAEENRGNFAAHAILPRDDVLVDWRRSIYTRAIILSIATIVFLVLTNLLARALRSRAQAEQNTAAAMQTLLLRDQALESITQGITITDEKAPGSPIIFTNSAFASLTRYTVEEIVGRSPLSFFDAAGASEIHQRLSSYYAAKRPWSFETEIKRKDGTAFLDSMKTSLMFDASGEITYSVTVHEDVTEIRQREELLLEAQKMESIGQLTGGIAHDFNNLLTAIQSNAEDMKEDLGEDKPVLKKQADIILRAATRGAGLVAQLMAFARKQQLQPQSVVVNELVEAFTKLVRSTMQANIRIDVHKGQNLPTVFVDPGRLESALLNLCINARDAMPNGGGITIETVACELDQAYAAENIEVTPGKYVCIAVTDTGVGMPAAVVEKAFTPFFTTKEVGKGTGLGLSMVYGFVKQSGGHAKIYSEVGLGTVIKIYLPAMEHAQATAAGAMEKAVVEAGKGSILLVEDDELVSQSISNKLTALGYAVLPVANANEAIETLKRTPDFDLVFSDVIMPGPMTGADLVREVRRRWPKIKVLLSSGYTESTVLGKIKLPRDVKLLSKPYSNADLARTVRQTLAGPFAPVED